MAARSARDRPISVGLGPCQNVFCLVTGAKAGDIHVVAPRAFLAQIFYGVEVPEEVIAADTAA